MGQDVAILSITAKLNNDSGKLTSELKKQVDYIEKNAGEIKLKADSSGVKDEINKVAKDILSLQNGKLKNFNLTKQLEGLVSVLSNPKKGGKSYLSELKKIYNDLLEIASLPNPEIVSKANQRQLDSFIKKQREIDVLQAQQTYSEKQERDKLIKNDRSSKDIVGLLRRSYARKNDARYQSSYTDSAISELSQKIGLSNDQQTKEDVKQYSQLLSLFDILLDKKKELSSSSDIKDAKALIEINKQLFAVKNQITGQAEKLQAKYNATDLIIPEFNKQEINKSVDKYMSYVHQRNQEILNKKKYDLGNSIIEFGQREQEKTSKRSEKAIQKASEKNEKFAQKTNIQNTSNDEINNIAGEFENVSSSAKKAADSINDVSDATRNLEASGNKQTDLYAKSFEKIKNNFADLEKYAVSAEDAFAKIQELNQKRENQTFDPDKDRKDFIGYMQRLYDLEDDNFTPSEIDDDYYYESIDNYQNFTDRISEMTNAQLKEIEALKKAANETSSSDIIDNQTDVSQNIQDIENLTQRVQNLEDNFQKLREKTENIGNIGNEFDTITQSVNSFSEALSKINIQMEDLRFFMGNTDIAYHAGDLEHLNTTSKPESWTDRIDALTYGGYGAWGSGTYLTKNIADLPSITKNGRQAIYGIDLSKYNLYTNKTDEQAEKLNTYLKNLEKFILSSSDFRGFDNDIKDISVDSLFNDMKYVFTDINLEYSKFVQFINEMKSLVSESGIDSEGIYHLSNTSLQNSDSIPTRFMKMLGYQGVNNSWLNGYDNVEHGSVIYDLDPNDPYIKKFTDTDSLISYNKKLLTQLTPVLQNIDEDSSKLIAPTESIIKNLESEHDIIQTYKESLEEKDTKKKTDSKDLFEDSYGQLSFLPASEYTSNAIVSQEKLQNSISDTNTQIEGQISLFDKLDNISSTEKTQKDQDYISKQSKEIKENTKDLNKDSSDANTSNELTDMQSLYNSINIVSEAIREKNELLKEESNIVSSSVQSEISQFTSLKSAVDSVSTSIKNKNEELQKQKNNQDDTTTDSDNHKKKQPNTNSKKDSNIPSTYVKNINNAYNEAKKINDLLNKSEKVKNQLSSNMFDNDLFSNLSSDIDALNNKLKSGKISIDKYKDGFNSLLSSYKNNDAISRSKQIIEDTLSQNKSGNFDVVVNKANTAVEELNQKLLSGKITISKYNNEIDNLASSLRSIDDYAEDADQALVKMNSNVKRGSKIIFSGKTYDKNGNVNGAKVISELNGEKITQTYKDVIGGMQSVVSQSGKSTSAIGSFFDGLKSKWGDVAKYMLSFGSIYEIWDVIKQGVSIIKDLDDALTEMSKVSDEPLENLQKYQKESFTIADNIGSTGKQIQDSTSDFLRLGESFNEAKKSAEAANILFNVSEFDSIDTATESLIAMSSAYKDLDKMEINDKLNNIGNNYSIATDGIATALQKSASALTTAGVDIDKAIALITAGNAVVQDPDSVGAGIRTIALRLMGTDAAKKELESIGEDTSDFIVQTASKINDEFKAFTSVASNDFEGISILDDNGNNRDPYEILQDVADIYEEIVETDKKFGTNHLNGLLELMAGKNRSNIAASIIQNGDMLRSVYEDSQKSEGSAMEENQKYLDSISGHLDQLKNKWQEVWSDTAGRDQINFFLDIGKGILDIVDNIGLLQTALGGLGLLYGAKNYFTGEGLLADLFG